MTASAERVGGPRRARRQRLSRSADFERVYREGRSHASRYLVVYVFPRERAGSEGAGSEGARMGVSVGRRVGSAVERNRVKRLLRDAFRAASGGLPGGHDFVLVARPELRDLARDGGAGAVERALREVLEKAAADKDAKR